MSDRCRGDAASMWRKSLSLIASTSTLVAVAGVIATLDFIRAVGPAPWPPQHRYLAEIPLARDVFDLLH